MRAIVCASERNRERGREMREHKKVETVSRKRGRETESAIGAIALKKIGSNGKGGRSKKVIQLVAWQPSILYLGREFLLKVGYNFFPNIPNPLIYFLLTEGAPMINFSYHLML